MFDSFKKKGKKTDKENPRRLGGFQLIKMAIGGAAQLRSNADTVNKLNVFPVPDGDTGDNMRMTIEAGINALENLDTDDLAEVMRVFSHGMLLGARGNSGVILSQFFAGIAKGFESAEEADPETLGKALEKGVQQAYTSVMTPTEGTILTVARESVEYAVNRINPESTIRTFFADLVKEMKRSLDRTPEILTVLKEAGVVDSGGAGLLYIMEGFNRVLNGEEIEDTTPVEAQSKPAVDVSKFGADSEMTYGYCTELLVQLTNAKTDVAAFDIEPLKEFLMSIGDSVVCFMTDSIVKIHVHTLTPDKVLGYCLQYGEFLTVKIENMSLQHSELDEKKEAPAKEEPAAEKKKYGIVQVCIGAGIEEIFRDFGTDVIVEGGQTQNPSTNDFLDAFAKVNAEHIFVFPNNGNIILAASQAAELYDKAEVHVIPSKSLGTGYVALSCIDPMAESADDIIAAINEAMGRVTTGYVSPSIRDAEINGVRIKKGDTIGIIDKKIVLSESERAAAAKALADKLLALPEKFMLTVFCGKDATEDERAALNEAIATDHSDAELYFIDGGQDIYPYIYVAE
ncbi:MAG: DAK2 domain-containing protein [Clostridia bacterium]|nr:DAK2 domain-containing protein [Clostridia bacterium]